MFLSLRNRYFSLMWRGSNVRLVKEVLIREEDEEERTSVKTGKANMQRRKGRTMSDESSSDSEDYVTADEDSIDETVNVHRIKHHSIKGSKKRKQSVSTASSLSFIRPTKEDVTPLSKNSQGHLANQKNPAREKAQQQNQLCSQMNTSRGTFPATAASDIPTSKHSDTITSKCPTAHQVATVPGDKQNGVSGQSELVSKTHGQHILTDTGSAKPNLTYSQVVRGSSPVVSKGSLTHGTHPKQVAANDAANHSQRSITSQASTQGIESVSPLSRKSSSSSSIEKSLGGRKVGEEKTSCAEDIVSNKKSHSEGLYAKAKSREKHPKGIKASRHVKQQVADMGHGSSGKQLQVDQISAVAPVKMVRQKQSIATEGKSLKSDDDGENQLLTSQLNALPKKTYNTCQQSIRHAKSAGLPGTGIPPGAVPKRTVPNGGDAILGSESGNISTEGNKLEEEAESLDLEDSRMASSSGFFSCIRNKVFGFFMSGKKTKKAEEKLLSEEDISVIVPLEDEIGAASLSSSEFKNPEDTQTILSTKRDTKMFPRYGSAQAGSLLTRDQSEGACVELNAAVHAGQVLTAAAGASAAEPRIPRTHAVANLNAAVVLDSLKKDGLRAAKETLSSFSTQEIIPTECQQSSIGSNQDVRGKNAVPGLDVCQKGTIVTEKKAHVRTRSQTQPVTATSTTASSKATKIKVPLAASKPQLSTEKSANDTSANRATKDSVPSRMSVEKEKANCSLATDATRKVDVGRPVADQEEGEYVSSNSDAVGQPVVTSTSLSNTAMRRSREKGCLANTSKQPAKDANSLDPSGGAVSTQALRSLADAMLSTSGQSMQIAKPGTKESRPATATHCRMSTVQASETTVPGPTVGAAKPETHSPLPKSLDHTPVKNAIQTTVTSPGYSRPDQAPKNMGVAQTQSVTLLPAKSTYDSVIDGPFISFADSAAQGATSEGALASGRVPTSVTKKSGAQGGMVAANIQPVIAAGPLCGPPSGVVSHSMQAAKSEEGLGKVSVSVVQGLSPASISTHGGISFGKNTLSSQDATVTSKTSSEPRPVGVHPTYARVTSHSLQQTNHVAHMPRDSGTSQPRPRQAHGSAAPSLASPKVPLNGKPVLVPHTSGRSVGGASAGTATGVMNEPSSQAHRPEFLPPPMFSDGTGIPLLHPPNTAPNPLYQLPPSKDTGSMGVGQSSSTQLPKSAMLNRQGQQTVSTPNQCNFNAAGGNPFGTVGVRPSFSQVLNCAEKLSPPAWAPSSTAQWPNEPTKGFGLPKLPTLQQSPLTDPTGPKGHVPAVQAAKPVEQGSALHGPQLGGGRTGAMLLDGSPLSNVPVQQVASGTHLDPPGNSRSVKGLNGKSPLRHHIVDIHCDDEDDEQEKSPPRSSTGREEEGEEEREDRDSSESDKEEVCTTSSDAGNRRKLKAKRQLHYQEAAGGEPEEKQAQEKGVQKAGKEKQRTKKNEEKALKGTDQKSAKVVKESKVTAHTLVETKGVKAIAPPPPPASKPVAREAASGKKPKPSMVVDRSSGTKLKTLEPAREDSRSKVAAQKKERKKRATYVPHISAIPERDDSNCDDEEESGKTRKASKRNKRRVKGQGGVTVNFRKSINCCCETVCDLCVP